MHPDASGHSPDGRWWWDGSRWLPAWSLDGRTWFDGMRGAPVSGSTRRGPGDWSRGVVLPLVLWLMTLSAFPIVVLQAVAQLGPGRALAEHVLVRLAVVVGACLATTPVMGYQLGRDGHWLQTLWVAALFGGQLIRERHTDEVAAQWRVPGAEEPATTRLPLAPSCWPASVACTSVAAVDPAPQPVEPIPSAGRRRRSKVLGSQAVIEGRWREYLQLAPAQAEPVAPRLPSRAHDPRAGSGAGTPSRSAA
jgi:hypothetical protein